MLSAVLLVSVTASTAAVRHALNATLPFAQLMKDHMNLSAFLVVDVDTMLRLEMSSKALNMGAVERHFRIAINVMDVSYNCAKPALELARLAFVHLVKTVNERSLLKAGISRSR